MTAKHHENLDSMLTAAPPSHSIISPLWSIRRLKTQASLRPRGKSIIQKRSGRNCTSLEILCKVESLSLPQEDFTYTTS